MSTLNAAARIARRAAGSVAVGSDLSGNILGGVVGAGAINVSSSFVGDIRLLNPDVFSFESRIELEARVYDTETLYGDVDWASVRDITLAKLKRRVTLNPLGRVTSDIVADIDAEKHNKKTVVITPDRLPDKEIAMSNPDRDILIPRNVRVKAIFAEGE